MPNRRKKKSKKKIKDLKKLLIIVAIIIATIWAIYGIISLVITPSKTFMVEKGFVSNEEEMVGYIIREETVLEEKYKDAPLKQIKEEGAKVAKDETIFSYISKGESTYEQKIKELDDEIQRAMDSKSNIFSGDIKILDSNIEGYLEKINGLNDVQKVAEYKNNMNKDIEKKAKIVGDLSPTGSYIKKLINERADIEKNLNEATEYIKAPIAGIVSYRVDGLESVLTPASFSNISEKTLKDLKLQTGSIVPASKNQAKIINNYKCYLVTIMDSEYSKSANIGDILKVRLNDNAIVPATIEYISEEPDETRVIVFKITRDTEMLTNYRKISFDVIWWSYEGLRIPNSALIKKDNETGVMKVKADYNEYIRIKVLKQNDMYSIIGNLTSQDMQEMGLENEDLKEVKIYDEILANP